MTILDPNSLFELVLKKVNLRFIEPHPYSAVQADPTPKFFDRTERFYDLFVCNPLYNRLMWGYSTKRDAIILEDALSLSKEGWAPDAGYGSLAFAAETDNVIEINPEKRENPR